VIQKLARAREEVINIVLVLEERRERPLIIVRVWELEGRV
jgi:hypothetical protein